MTSQARINPNGSIDLPADMLERLGISVGAEVTLEETPNGISISLSRDELIRRAQEWTQRVLGDKAGHAVDDFLAERRREAENE